MGLRNSLFVRVTEQSMSASLCGVIIWKRKTVSMDCISRNIGLLTIGCGVFTGCMGSAVVKGCK